MDDAEVIGRIGALVDEEHALEREVGQQGPDSDAAARLSELEVALDQCWDLLRQRRARRDMGQDPDEARVRPPEVVERSPDDKLAPTAFPDFAVYVSWILGIRD